MRRWFSTDVEVPVEGPAYSRQSLLDLLGAQQKTATKEQGQRTEIGKRAKKRLGGKSNQYRVPTVQESRPPSSSSGNRSSSPKSRAQVVSRDA